MRSIRSRYWRMARLTGATIRLEPESNAPTAAQTQVRGAIVQRDKKSGGTCPPDRTWRAPRVRRKSGAASVLDEDLVAFLRDHRQRCENQQYHRHADQEIGDRAGHEGGRIAAGDQHGAAEVL